MCLQSDKHFGDEKSNTLSRIKDNGYLVLEHRNIDIDHKDTAKVQYILEDPRKPTVAFPTMPRLIFPDGDSSQIFRVFQTPPVVLVSTQYHPS